MGSYIYRTTPRLVRPTATVKLDDGTLVHTAVTGYTYAYKPYWSWGADRENAKLERRYIDPARRAFRAKNLPVPPYGASLDDKATAGPTVGERVFRTSSRVALVDDDAFSRIGVIINLDGSTNDHRTFAQRIDPTHYNPRTRSIRIMQYVGRIVSHDYGFSRVSLPPSAPPVDITEVDAWKAKLDPADRELFERLETIYTPTN